MAKPLQLAAIAAVCTALLCACSSAGAQSDGVGGTVSPTGLTIYLYEPAKEGGDKDDAPEAIKDDPETPWREDSKRLASRRTGLKDDPNTPWREDFRTPTAQRREEARAKRERNKPQQ